MDKVACGKCSSSIDISSRHSSFYTASLFITCHPDEEQGARYRPHSERQAHFTHTKKNSNERIEIFSMRGVEDVRGLYTFNPVRNLCTDFVPIAVLRVRFTVIINDDCGRIWKEPFVAS